MTDAARHLTREGSLRGLGVRVETAHRLHGHASTRRFYRVSTGEGGGVLVVYPAGQESELDRYENTADWFRAAGVRVPRVFVRGEQSLLVEDGGARMLETHPTDPTLRARCYRQATGVILRIEAHARRAGLPNAGWVLNAERLRHELEFMERHTLHDWLGIAHGGSARAECYDRLAAACDALPRVGCHRDFHARNLLVTGDRLMVLDFQDVMPGPLFYDAASLLWDNYCEVDPRLQAAVLSDYWHAVPRRLEQSPEWGDPDSPPGLLPAARQAFNLVALQRSLKALGTFGYQIAVAGYSHYAEYVPHTWSHARRAMRALGWHEMESELAVVARLLA